MTEDRVSRPRKNSRKTNSVSRSNSCTNGSADESQMIMDPSVDSPGTFPENQQPLDSACASPSKTEENDERCALCNCGSEMALILGQLTQYTVSSSTFKRIDKSKPENKTNDTQTISSTIKKKGDKILKVKHRKSLNENSSLPLDMTTFGTATMQDLSDVMDVNNCLWAHHCCAAWSAGVCQTDSYDLENVDRAVAKALQKKCSHCQRYGASVECQVHRCNKLFHYPCCASAGAFQNITSMILLCPDHLDRTEKLADAQASCDACEKTDNLNFQLFCTSCGRHFHSYCADVTIPITPVVRMGWQCSYCKVCQGCKQPGDEDKMLCCDHCDKGYHIYCLNPPISTVPKSVWKCLSCRKCEDCGSMRPGAGPSCRWHSNFTLCGPCYQQRKKGQCCSVCNRAVRSTNTNDVLQCAQCLKCVHGECDPDGAEISTYICPLCVATGNEITISIQDETNDSVSSFDIDHLANTGQTIVSIEDAELFSIAASAEFIASVNNNPESVVSLPKYEDMDDKMSVSTVDSPCSSTVGDESSLSSFPKSKRRDSNRMHKKLHSRKSRNSITRSIDSISMTNDDENFKSIVTSPDSSSLQMKMDITSSDLGVEDEDDDDDDSDSGGGGDNNEEGLHSTVVIVSTRDSYSLKQDICMCCGSFGTGNDGYLIGCVQCGQCFHPYCVNVKVNEVILDRGWRCLDCTVCEGCGRNADEAHLLLCDICDISFHTYCLDPPLQEVPVGGWKCRWCAVCEDCGSKDAGFGCTWMANYSQCGPCSSEQYCSICSYAYEPGNLVIECEKCNRWLHGECDGLNTEEDASLASSMTYHCANCRPITKHLGIYSNLKTSQISKAHIKKSLNGAIQNTPIIGKKTKTLQAIKTQKLSRAALREQKRLELEALPLIPTDVNADETGVLDVDLNAVKNRLRNDELVKERLHLTDVGLKQIKALVIRAPINKTYPRKGRAKKHEEQKNISMPDDASLSRDSADERSMLGGERLEGPFEAEGIVSEHDVLSPVSDLLTNIKQEEGLEMDIMAGDTAAETDELIEDNHDDPVVENGNVLSQEDMKDPFEFFGVSLLEKRLYMELESLGCETEHAKQKKLRKEKRREKRMRKAAKLAEASRLDFEMMKGPSVPDPTAAAVTAVAVVSKSESTPTSTPSTVDSSQTIYQPTVSSTSSTTTTVVIAEKETIKSEANNVQSSETEPTIDVKVSEIKCEEESTTKSVTTTVSTTTAPPPDLALINVGVDLPHVPGHEVEQLLAGMEMDQVIPTQKTIPHPHPSVASHQSIPHQSIVSNALVNAINSAVVVENPMIPHQVMDQITKLSPSLMAAAKPSAMVSPAGSTDAFRAIFGEDAYPGKSRSGSDSQKIDTQKQLRKWENDEKLGDDATISPVLYANLVHTNLRIEYPDWPSRARSIARLWRKLPAEEREPFRTRARDNRVKLKAKNKKVKNPDGIPKATKTKVPLPEKSIIDTIRNSIPTPDSEMIAAKIARENMAKSYADTQTSGQPTILTVPEPQKLSPLLQNLSPSFSISSISGLTPTTPKSPFFPNTPTTPNSDGKTTKADKPKKPRPKLTKEQREAKQLLKKQNQQMLEREKQFKLLQQHHLFEQQRQAILQQSKTGGVGDPHHPIHPSVRFNSSMPSSISQDSLVQKAMLQQQAVAAAFTHHHGPSPYPVAVTSPIPSVVSQSISATIADQARPSSTSGRATPKTPNSVKGEDSKKSGNTPELNTSRSSNPSTPTSTKGAPTTPSFLSSSEASAKAVQEHFMRTNPTAAYDEMRRAEVESLLSRPLDHATSAEQQQALLLQQQQYMASQQQYIQWQLAQQETLYGHSSKVPGDKNLPVVDNEEQHQERIRYLYQQRQMFKDFPQGGPVPPVPPTPLVTQANSSKNNAENTTSPTQGGEGQGPGPGPGPGPGCPPRVPPYFPGANSPEGAMYQQMFMEYVMRYRKGQEVDPSLPPPHQLYNTMMTEIAKQYYQRHGSFGKLFPPYTSGYPPHIPPPQRPPFNERMPAPPFGKPGTEMEGSSGAAAAAFARPSFMPPRQPRPPFMDDTSKSFHQRPQTNQSPNTLPKSASFQISRIAADSTSNDEFPDSSDKTEKPKRTSKPETTTTTTDNENEITSSRNSTSDDPRKNPDPDDESKVSSASSKNLTGGGSSSSNALDDEGSNEASCKSASSSATDNDRLSSVGMLDTDRMSASTTTTREITSSNYDSDDDDDDDGDMIAGCFSSCNSRHPMSTVTTRETTTTHSDDDDDGRESKRGQSFKHYDSDDNLVPVSDIQFGDDEFERCLLRKPVRSKKPSRFVVCSNYDEKDEEEFQCSNKILCSGRDFDDGNNGDDFSDEECFSSSNCRNSSFYNDDNVCSWDDDDRRSRTLTCRTNCFQDGEDLELARQYVSYDEDDFDEDNTNIFDADRLTTERSLCSDEKPTPSSAKDAIDSTEHSTGSKTRTQPTPPSTHSPAPPHSMSPIQHALYPPMPGPGMSQPRFPRMGFGVGRMQFDHMQNKFINPSSIHSAMMNQNPMKPGTPSPQSKGKAALESDKSTKHDPTTSSDTNTSDSTKFSLPPQFHAGGLTVSESDFSRKKMDLPNQANWAFPNMNFDSKKLDDASLKSPPFTSKGGIEAKSPFDMLSNSVRPSTPLLSGNGGLGMPIPGSSSSQSLTGSTNSTPGISSLSATSGMPPFSPTSSSPVQKSNVVTLHPGSPQYHQIFIYQHQLLIMQFQQYQFQLQLQFQQLSQQQISPQQQFLLQQQFHQQMMLLQQQFMQQQAQLHRMAASGIQFTEHQLNAMYQQQMMTQQSYRQWVLTLPPDQQMHLQQRMQASMQQVHHQMTQIIQNARAEEDQPKKKPSKPRRLNKKKSLTSSAEKEPAAQQQPKFPVPELADDMKQHTKRQQQQSTPSVISSENPLITTHTVSSPQSAASMSHKDKDSPAAMLANSSYVMSPHVATITKPHSVIASSPSIIGAIERSKAEQNRATAFSPTIPNTVTTTASSTALTTSPVVSSPSFTNPPPGHNFPYDETFLRKEKMRHEIERAQHEMKLLSAQKQAEQLLQPRSSVTKPYFPTHPSQLFQRAKSAVGDKPSAADKLKGPDSMKTPSGPIPVPIGDTSTFGPRASLNQMAAEVIRNHTSLHAADPLLSAVVKERRSSPFSVNTLLQNSSEKTLENGNPPDMKHFPGMFRASDASDKNLLKAAEHSADLSKLIEMEKKALMKTPKKKEKEKLMEEKRRLREIERQKKRDEKAKLKLLKEQKKAEKIQARLHKQKLLADAKQLALKKRQKAIPPLPAPEVSTEQITSPVPTITPKTPPPPAPPKIPLCEPKVHLVYPLTQPVGFKKENASLKVAGMYGAGAMVGLDDVYADRPPTPPPLTLDTTNLLHSTTDPTMIPLFPSPERSYKDDENELVKITSPATLTVLSADSTVNMAGDEIPQAVQKPEEKDTKPDKDALTISHCNECYQPLPDKVFYVDKRFEEISESPWNKDELCLSDNLAFCSNECIELFQQKVHYDVEDDDVELIDAVKTAAMVSMDEYQQFSPLPSDNLRGDISAPGIDSQLGVVKPEDIRKPRWKRWYFQPSERKKVRRKLTKEELVELMAKYDVRLKPSDGIKDRRVCIFCRAVGDGEPNITSRLLNYSVDVWVHLNCALWSTEVYEALNGGLHNVDKAYARSQSTRCSHCHKIGATVNCSHSFGVQQRQHCDKIFHFACAVQSKCEFYKDKTILCANHKSFGTPNEELRSYVVRRKVYIDRDITKQIAKMLNKNNELERKEYTFRVGNLIFHELGHIPTNLLEPFSTKEFLYPINYESTTIFWDYHDIRRRRYYTCSITERFRTPRFKVKVHANGTESSQYTSCTAKGVWEEIVNTIQKHREKDSLLKVFPEFIKGEELFGLSEPTIQRMVESLPGIDTIPSYNFKFGRTPILIAELPLALNPTGCIRSEKFRKHHSRPLAMRSAHERVEKPSVDPLNTDETWLTYSQRNAYISSTKSSQYRRMQKDWRNCVVLGRSRIQGLGLFTKKDIDENTFVIEYIGSLIRDEVANRLEKRYEHQNRGIYMFRIDHDVVVDATMSGGPARYINHSCNPNCVAEIVNIEGRKRIIIITSRKIAKGEELTYDYKFEFEDDSSKIACLCGASNCRKWMN